MKRTLNIYSLAIILAIAIFSCKKDDNSNSNSNSTSTINNTIQQGKWKITYYNDSGTNHTSHYTGYEFQFNANNTITATKTGSSTVSGTWSTGNDDSTVKLILNFGAISPFVELNDDWHVIQETSVLIKLQDVSGGNGGTDDLTFEKI